MSKEGSSLNVQTEKVKRGLSAEFRSFATCVVLTDVSRKGAKSQRGSIPKISMLCDFAPLRESFLTNPIFSRNGGEPEFRNHANALVLCFEPQPLGFLDLVILWSLRFGPSVLPIVPLGCKLTLQPGYLPQAFGLLRDFARQSRFSIA